MTDVYNRFQGARSTYAAKKPVRAATTENISLTGFQTVDGVTFASSDEDANYNMRCLVKDQSDTTANGVYIVNSGDWTRDKDFDGNTDYTRGTIVYVAQGTVNGGRMFNVSSADPQSIGINATSFRRFSLDYITQHGADIASATTIDLDSATGEIVDVTGTTNISAITLSDGRMRIVRFTGVHTLFHSSSLVLPGAQNMVTAAGDYAVFVGYSSGVVRCISYIRYDGHYLTVGAATLAGSATTDLGSNISQVLAVSGSSTGITSFGTSAPTGAIKFLRFTGAPLIVSSTDLVLPGSQDIQVEAGDCMIARHDGSGTWRTDGYVRTNSHPLTTGSATVASAATTELGSVREKYVTISGTVSITSFGSTAPTGAVKHLYFSGSLTLTYNATSLILPTAANIQTQAGDTAIVVHEGSGNWRVTSFNRAQPRQMLSVDTTATSTPTSTSGSTAESDLMTYSLTASNLAADGYGVRINAWGVTSTSAFNKTLKAYFGGTALADTGALALTGHSWKFQSDVIRTSTAAQLAHTLTYGSSATALPALLALSTPGEALSTSSTAITIKVTAICSSTGAAEVTQNGMTVELVPTP